jgi:hypothetical protein
MVQIKLSQAVLFILAAAAVVPILALPIPVKGAVTKIWNRFRSVFFMACLMFNFSLYIPVLATANLTRRLRRHTLKLTRRLQVHRRMPILNLILGISEYIFFPVSFYMARLSINS